MTVSFYDFTLAVSGFWFYSSCLLCRRETDKYGKTSAFQYIVVALNCHNPALICVEVYIVQFLMDIEVAVCVHPEHNHV